MGKQTPQAPAAPDPVQMANAQGAANKETAITQARLNAVDQRGPFGSVTYTESTNAPQYDDWGQVIPGSGDGTPKFTQNIQLSPEQQALYNTRTGIEQKAYDTAGQAIGNVQGVLSSPFSLDNLPSLATGVSGGTPQAGYNAVGPQFGIAPAGQIKGVLGDAGGMQRAVPLSEFEGQIADVGGTQRSISPTGQQTGVGYSNPIQNSFNQGGPLAGNVGPTGQAQSLTPAGGIQSGINTNGIQQTPISANDFSQQGQQVQQALMQRFNQDIGRREEDVISRLNAEGIQRGSAGFSNAQDDLNRARNDAFGQSVLLGSQEQDRLFNQQLSANQNQFGQRQAMGDFANAAQNQQFGQNLAGGQFQNDALNNLMQQQLAAGQFQNATAGQQYQQNLGAAQFGNQAQSQGYGQALSNAQFGNQALNDLFQQQAQAGAFGNQAQAQDFGQAQARQQAQNAAAGANFGQNLQAGNFSNAAQQQLFAQLLSGGQFANAAQAQQFGQNAAQQQAFNQAAGQQTANNQGQAAFYNTAQQQGFDQSMQNAALQNQARQQSIAEQQLMRSQPINEIATLLGLGGGIQVPNGAPNFGVGVGQTDVMGAYGLQQQALQNQYNQQLQAQNALWGGLGNLGGAAASALIMSDARTKNIIRRVGETATGVPLYLYEYKHDPGTQIVGVMAQDVQARDPQAVHEINGVLHVDYARVA